MAEKVENQEESKDVKKVEVSLKDLMIEKFKDELKSLESSIEDTKKFLEEIDDIYVKVQLSEKFQMMEKYKQFLTETF